MNQWNKITALFLIFLLMGILAFSQSKEELEKKKRELQQQIELNNKLLKQTRQQKQLTLSQLLLLNNKISTREEYIRSLRYEIKILNKKIAKTQEQIQSLKHELQALKEEYAKMIYYAYRNRSAYERLMFIFSSESFNQAYLRLKYLQQYSEYRKTQAEKIEKAQKLLNKKLLELQAQKAEKQKLLNQQEEQKALLANEKKQQEQTVAQLKQKEKQLKKEVETKRKEQLKLQKAIQKLIEEEIARSKEKGKLSLTPEAIALGKSFAENIGKLPWPVEKGVIVGRFGEQPHPVLKNVKIKNNGVDISTLEEATARAVFDGEVSMVLFIPGVGKAVMIRHGEFLSVYSNLKETFVKKGDKVKVKQPIGTINIDENGETKLHFEIWKSKTILDPTDWLYKAK
jgi:septal ring factor EnvC (AmiA/AmiB activator)